MAALTEASWIVPSVRWRTPPAGRSSARLAEGDAGVLDVAAPFPMSQPAMTKHLRVLEEAGLISRHRQARQRLCHLEPRRLKQLSDWVGSYREFWEESFERLDELLDRACEGTKNTGHRGRRKRRRNVTMTDRRDRNHRHRRESRLSASGGSSRRHRQLVSIAPSPRANPPPLVGAAASGGDRVRRRPAGRRHLADRPPCT